MKKDTIKPIGARCLIEIEKAASKSSSGLYMNNENNAALTPIRGTVIAVGDASTFKKGDKVFFRRFSVDELKFITEEGEQAIFLIEDEDVLAIDLSV